MTENMSDDNSPTTKKRKANDGGSTVLHDDGGGGLFSSGLGYFSSGQCDDTPPTASTTCDGENLTQMDRMENIMLRIEEKLTAVSSLESRCANLEAECSSLKNMLETKTNSIKEHVDSKFDKQNKYNKMLVRNQSWKYSTPVYSFEHWENQWGFDGDIAEYLTESSECLKSMTEKLRRGDFPSDDGKGIDLEWSAGDPILDNNASLKMRPYWKEFANALTQFTPAFGVLPDSCETYFNLDNIQLGHEVQGLLKTALMNKPFQRLSFVNREDVDDNEGMMLNDILDIVNSNKHLQKLRIGNNLIGGDDIAKISSAVRYGSIVELDLSSCFEWNAGNDLGDKMITSLLSTGGLAKLQKLGLDSNGLNSSTIALLAGFLATNPPLREFDLSNNGLSGDCVDLLANALRSNRSLRLLHLPGNTINDDGKEAFRLVLNNDSSLNSIADSNHSCRVDAVFHFDCWNVCKKPESFNRARKIYNLLSKRNKSMSTSNVQHFGGIDVKLLPSILEAVQRYASVVHPSDRFQSGYCRVEPLSIVYEVMRKWDKVFPLYTDEGNSNNGSI